VKKLLFALLMPVFLAGMVFPQAGSWSDYITIHSFAEGIFEPVQMVKENGEDPKFYAGTGSWSDDPHEGLVFQVNTPDKRLGGLVDFAYGSRGAYPTIGDNAELWIRPFNWVRLDVGKFNIDTLRGQNFGDDFFQYIGPREGEDASFQRFAGRAGQGFLLSIIPNSRWFIGALVNPDLGAHYDNYDSQTHDAADVYKNGQYAVAYTDYNIGQFRIQYIGGDFERADYMVNNTPTITPHGYLQPVNYALGSRNAMSIQAAATFWGKKDLTAEIGVTYPIYIKDDVGTLQRPIKLALGARYKWDKLTVSGRIDGSFLGKEEHDENESAITNGFTLGGGFTANYNFGFAIVGFDAVVKYKAKDKGDFNPYLGQAVSWENDAFYLGFAGWIQKRFSNGAIKTGIGVSLPTNMKPTGTIYESDGATVRNWTKTAKAPLVITIPIVFSYYL
jgi:hypothetical protein